MYRFSVKNIQALLTGALLTVLSAGLHAEISADHARVRAVPPSSSNSAAYLTLRNDDNVPVSLIRANSSVANSVELHQVTEVGGHLKMSPVLSIEVPANGEVSLQPGGLHIMLIDLRQPLQEGRFVELVLEFSNGQKIPLNAQVLRLQPMMKHNMSEPQMNHQQK